MTTNASVLNDIPHWEVGTRATPTPYPTAPKPAPHQLLEILTDPAVIRLGYLAAALTTISLTVTALL
ncbi:hypothetical protein [Pseudosporangium ferrugineum]|uniref:Uncharacterized protein n=1 Tax=Pseudosporangium ferrugineum TaxID=439699 RepID=A0A2T0RDV0_9ACTN|nr:hypothetical protein [Pseudosporangium ferrugineum]PRY19331.1 hypothetical protein CLV70_13535 [Pseudosporangium ferrugineum]